MYGNGGADYSVKLTGSLPDNYIKKEEAKEKGWKEWVEIYMMFYRVLVSILHIKIARKSCQNRKIEYGMRRISITTADIEILKGYFFQTTA